MKKLLLTAAVAAFASSAFAEEGSFYLRADAGLSIVPKQKIVDVKFKSSKGFVADLGVGTYLMDNVRTELVFTNYFSAEQKGSVTTTTPAVPAAGANPAVPASTSSSSAKAKIQAMSIALKGVVDIFDYGVGKVFVGAGVGLTQLGAKIADMKAKKKNNFSYLGTVGTAFNVSEGVDLDVAYTFYDHGKTSSLKDVNGTTGKVKFSTHNVTAGIRFAL